MTYFLEKFYFKTVKYKLINKFIYKKVKKLLILKKIVLNFGSKTNNIKKLFSGLLALELIANQKGILTTGSIVGLKMHKKNPVGCKLSVKKKNLFKFFTSIIFQISVPLKNISNLSLIHSIKKNAVSFKIYNVFNFFELEKHYFFFNKLSELNFTLIVNTDKKKIFIFFGKLLQLL
jgi:ribosomal protein L5